MSRRSGIVAIEEDGGKKMTDFQRWLDRIDNLLQVQRDRCLNLISANFTGRELIELKMMIEVLMEKALEEQEPKTGWIPVSERLPEDRRTVLVTAYWHETYQVMMASYFGDGLWWCVPFNNCGEHMQRLHPKAWMELPEPYKESEANE